MITLGCGREGDVAQATRSGAWSAELKSHAAQCAVCGDVALVVGALVKERSRPIAGDVVADAGLVWWRAQLQARHRATERATRPIAVVEVLTLVVATAAGMLALARVWPQLQASLSAEAMAPLSGLGARLALGAAGVLAILLLRLMADHVEH